MNNGEIKGETGIKEYHVLSLSGGKDSTALAFFIRENMPEVHEQIEYVFCDTEKEIPETYDYLDKIEVFLDKPIKRLKPYMSFDHLYEVHGFLPSIAQRWCTIELKTKVFRKYIYDRFKKDGEGQVQLYIGIRADEAGRAENSIKSTDNLINQIYPFIENGIQKNDVMNILEKSGIGLPDYYNWRKRSGCYFCFFQSKNDWLNLYENHPDLFQKAIEYEFNSYDTDRNKWFGWNMDMPLKEMIKPDNMKKIREDYQKLIEKRLKQKTKYSNSLFESEDCYDESKCLFCHT